MANPLAPRRRAHALARVLSGIALASASACGPINHPPEPSARGASLAPSQPGCLGGAASLSAKGSYLGVNGLKSDSVGADQPGMRVFWLRLVHADTLAPLSSQAVIKASFYRQVANAVREAKRYEARVMRQDDGLLSVSVDLQKGGKWRVELTVVDEQGAEDAFVYEHEAKF